jgi:hypothetical protein
VTTDQPSSEYKPSAITRVLNVLVPHRGDEVANRGKAHEKQLETDILIPLMGPGRMLIGFQILRELKLALLGKVH